MALEIYPSVNNIGGTGKKITELKHTEWMNSLIQNSFVISGWTFPSPTASLTFTITGGGVLHLVGYWVKDLTNDYSVSLTASDVNYIYLQLTRDGAGKALGLQLVANLTGVTPSDAVFLGTATTDGSGYTSTDISGRMTRPWTTSAQPVYSGTITPVGYSEDVFDDVASGCYIIYNGTNLYKQKDDDLWVYDEVNDNWDALTGGGAAGMFPIGLEGEDLVFSSSTTIYQYDVSGDSWTTLQTWSTGTYSQSFNCCYKDGFVYGWDWDGVSIKKFYKQDQSDGTKTEITFDAILYPDFDYNSSSAVDVCVVFVWQDKVYCAVQKYGTSGYLVDTRIDIYEIDITNSKAYKTGSFNFMRNTIPFLSITPIGLIMTVNHSNYVWIGHTQAYASTMCVLLSPVNGTWEEIMYPRALPTTGFGYLDNRWVGGKLELYRYLGEASASAIYSEVHGYLLCNITQGTVGKTITVSSGDEYGVVVMKETSFNVTIVGL